MFLHEDFNSIKVRLELKFGLIFPPLGLRFQFHKGTIRTRLRLWMMATILYFNSIKVRLELEFKSKCGFKKRNFNSIKVRLERMASGAIGAPPGFQFHKGTIRTVLLLPIHSVLLYFNSIKVRLELKKDIATLTKEWHFNSIKVRLERKSLLRLIGMATNFNSIKVRLERKSLLRLIGMATNFNSIKVRLELLCGLLTLQTIEFQFHKGTIRTKH